MYCPVLTISDAGGDNANNRETTFKITSTKLYVPIVTLSTKDNLKPKDLKDQSTGMNTNQNYKHKI